MLIFLSCIYVAQAALLSVIETCRHGARAPIDFYQWDQGYWNEGMGELTQEGMRQQFLNGAEFRSRYVNSTSNIPGTYNASELYVRSTDVNRTIMSAESQMMGLFPTGPNIASNMQYKAVPPFGSVNFNTTIQGLGLNALPNAYQPVPIHVVAAPFDNMLYGYSPTSCPRMAQISSEVQNSADYQFRVQNYTAYLGKQLYEIFNTPVSYEYAGWYGDVLICDSFHGYSWPDGITEEIFQQMIGIMNYSNSYFYQNGGAQLASSQFFSQIISTFTGVINGTSTLKWSLYSAHDTTLIAFLYAMNQFNGNNPPFASTIVFELHSELNNKYAVQIKFNDVVLVLDGCTEMCDFDTFVELMNAWIIPDVVLACQMTEDHDLRNLAYNPFMHRRS